MPRSVSVVQRCILAACLLAGSAPAYAQGPNADRTNHDFGELTIVDAEPAADRLPEKRPVPDYDGRGKKPSSTSDDLLWIPRIVMAPLYLASEYLVRRPIGALVIGVERSKIAQRVLYLFTFGGNDNIGFSPTFQVDLGLSPSVGLYAWWDKLGAAKNHVRAYIADWGTQVINAAIADRYDLGEHSSVSLRASYLQRTDNLFYGLGPDSRPDNESRYESQAFEAGPGFDLELVRGVNVSTNAGVRNVTYGNATFNQGPELIDRVRQGDLPPPGRFLVGGYTSLFDNATMALDSRRDRHHSGARLALTGAPSFDVSQHPGASWLRYEAHAAAFWDITGTERLLTISADALFVDPLQGGQRGIPFTEEISLGGTTLMRGFLPGRLYDRSAAVTTLGYEWPIWAFLDGTMQASLGNVFGAGLRGFDVDRLRFSGVLGIRTNSSPDHQFELLTGFGTEPFDQGAAVKSFRLALGATRGF